MAQGLSTKDKPQIDRSEKLYTHLEMVTKLSLLMNTNYWKPFFKLLYLYFDEVQLSRVHNMAGACNKLKDIGVIEYGDYRELRKMFSSINQWECVKVIEEYTKMMQRHKAPVYREKEHIQGEEIQIQHSQNNVTEKSKSTDNVSEILEAKQNTDTELNIFLRNIADDIKTSELERMKFMMRGQSGIGKRVLDKLKSPTDLFEHLQYRHMLDKNNLLYVQSLLWHTGRMDLYKRMVDFARDFSTKPLHFFAPNLQPVNGYKHLHFHVNGEIRDLRREDVEHLRSLVARLVCVPVEFIQLRGVLPIEKLQITFMLPEAVKSALLKLTEAEKCLLQDMMIDLFTLDDHQITVAGQSSYNSRQHSFAVELRELKGFDYYTFPGRCGDKDYIILVGGKGKMVQLNKLQEIIEDTNIPVCLLLKLQTQELEEEEDATELSQETRTLLSANISNKWYWTVVPEEGLHYSWTSFNVYQNMLEASLMDGEIEIFENFKSKLSACRDLSEIFKMYHDRFEIYPGKSTNTGDEEIAVCIFEMESKYEDRDIKIMKKNKVKLYEMSKRTKESRRIQEHLAQNKITFSGRIELTSVIRKEESNLMMHHSNLNAISSCRVKSRKGGDEIENKECIVLYCIGKGTVPLLEKEFPTTIQGFPVDVRDGYDVAGNTCKQYHDPLKFGCSIGKAARPKAGSIGPFVEEKNANSSGFLSCSHVFLEEIKAKRGYLFSQDDTMIDVVQPADIDASTADLRNRKCGHLQCAFLGNVDVDGIETGTDIAYCVATSRNPQNACFPDVDESQKRENGYQQYPSMGNVLWRLSDDDMERVVYKCGRSTGFTKGSIVTNYATMKRSLVTFNYFTHRKRSIDLKGMYEIHSIGEPFFLPGDSGSAVYIKRNGEFCLIGIAVGCFDKSGGICYVSSISAAKSALAKYNIDFRVRLFGQEYMAID